ncbi:regulatory protein [Marinomonas sp. MED121]|uniref:EamA family transporter n=1 Tax=Marinomonas sp. MED121 TaxID=314277 RepID=UPI0000690A48|nr:EamA family transporter [Marinomonas sp. MED121]EAQ63993.1 regulatory protein [Marinomonas sp. MED121]
MAIKDQALGNILLTALAPIMWGTTYVVASELLPQDRPFTAALIRSLPAGILLILWGYVFLPKVSLTIKQWLQLIILSGLNIGVFQALLFVAAYRLPGGIAAVVGAIQPLLMMLIVWFFEHKRPQLKVVLMALISVLGMSLLFVSPQTQWDSLGLIAAFAGTLCLGFGTYLARRWNNGMSTLSFTGWQLGLGGLLLLPLAWLFEGALPSLTTNNYLGYGYLSIFGALLAYSLWFRGITKLSSVSVSSLGLLSPVTAILVGWAVLEQALTPRESIAILIVLSSVLLLQRWLNSSPENKANKAEVMVAETNLVQQK